MNECEQGGASDNVGGGWEEGRGRDVDLTLIEVHTLCLGLGTIRGPPPRAVMYEQEWRRMETTAENILI